MRALNDKYADMPVTLKSPALNPFDQSSDWYDTDGEAVVTFETMQHRLWEQWKQDCVSFDHSSCDHGESVDDRLEQTEDGMYRLKDCDAKRVVDHSNFDPDAIRGPGVYLDGTHYDTDGSVDESYTIVVPYSFLSPKLCRQWLKKLNEQYDREFQLEITDEQNEEDTGGE